MNLNDLENYRLDLLAEHKADLEAIDRLIARERAKLHPVSERNGSSTSPVRTTTGRKTSLSEVVRRKVKSLEGDFTRRDVEKAIESSNFPLRKFNQKTLGVILWTLAHNGEIETVKSGTDGKGGAIYRRAHK